MTAIAYFVFLGFTPLLLLYSMLGIGFAPRKWRKYLPFIVLGIGLISYSYPPKIEGDLTRYFQMAEDVGKLTFNESFGYFGKNENFDGGLWGSIIVFWAVGKIGLVHILPMITACIVYGIAFYISCDTAEQYEAYDIIPKVMIFQFSMLPFFSVVGNIRNISAFALIMLAVYLDTVKNKKNIGIFLLYVLPCFIHTSAVVLILLRLSLALSSKLKFLFLIIIFLFPTMIELLYSNLARITVGGSIGSIIRNFSMKAYWYLHDKDSTEWARQVARSRYQKLNRLVLLAFAIMIITMLCFDLLKNVRQSQKKFLTYLFLIAIMTVACSWFTTPHYWRFSAVSVVAVGSLMVPLLKKQYLSRGNHMVIQLSAMFFGLLGVLLQIWQFQYNVDIFEWFGNILLNNFYTVVIQMLGGLFL